MVIHCLQAGRRLGSVRHLYLSILGSAMTTAF